MKKVIPIFLAVALLLLATACGGAPQDESTALQNELDTLQSEYEALQSEYDKLQEKRELLKQGIEAAMGTIQNEKGELALTRFSIRELGSYVTDDNVLTVIVELASDYTLVSGDLEIIAGLVNVFVTARLLDEDGLEVGSADASVSCFHGINRAALSFEFKNAPDYHTISYTQTVFESSEIPAPLLATAMTEAGGWISYSLKNLTENVIDYYHVTAVFFEDGAPVGYVRREAANKAENMLLKPGESTTLTFQGPVSYDDYELYYSGWTEADSGGDR